MRQVNKVFQQGPVGRSLEASSVFTRRHPAQADTLFLLWQFNRIDEVFERMAEVVGGAEERCSKREPLKHWWSGCLFPTTAGQLLDMVNGCNMNQEEHVKELSSTYFSRLPVESPQELKWTLSPWAFSSKARKNRRKNRTHILLWFQASFEDDFLSICIFLRQVIISLQTHQACFDARHSQWTQMQRFLNLVQQTESCKENSGP